MKIKNENEVMPLPNDMDKECIELSNLLNRLPGVKTIESCMGHGKHPYWLWFQCMNINTLSRLARAVNDRYSDGRWEIMCDSIDGEPRGVFWLRTIEILDIDTLNKSIKELMENIEYWFHDEFDDYFENGYKNTNGEYVAEQNLDYYGNPLSLEQQIKQGEKKPTKWTEEGAMLAEFEKQASYTTIVETGDGGINALVTRELPTNGEQKSADKNESKFEVGDWVVENGVNRNPIQITSFEEDKGVGTKVWFSNDTGTYVEFLKGYHRWSLDDVNDGDVLKEDSCIFIIERMKPNGTAIVHCCLFDDGDFVLGSTLSFDVDSTYPATKEQRDLLFQKMEEAGYEWDDKKKELSCYMA